jgi:hypothetical protein
MIEKLIIQFKIELEKENDLSFEILSSSLVSIPFFKICQVGLIDSENILISGKDELREIIRKNSVLNLYSENESLDNVVVLFLNEPSLLDVTITTTQINQFDIEKLKKFIVEFTGSFEGLNIRCLNSRVDVFDDNVDYPKLRPPKVREILGDESIIQIVDLKYLELNATSVGFSGAFLEMLGAIKHSPNVKVEKINELFLLTWSPSLELNVVNEALSVRDEMLSIVPAPLSYEFNELGDKNILNLKWTEKLLKPNFFSYYDEGLQLGIKLVITQNGILDIEMGKAFKAEAEKMQLSNGKPVLKIIAVCSNREEANAFQNFSQFGIYKVLYIDNELNIWDINPKGNWKN